MEERKSKKQIYWKERERALIVSSPYANDLIRACNEFDLLQQKRRRFLLIIFDGGVVQFIQLINNNEGVKTMLEKKRNEFGRKCLREENSLWHLSKHHRISIPPTHLTTPVSPFSTPFWL